MLLKLYFIAAPLASILFNTCVLELLVARRRHCSTYQTDVSTVRPMACSCNPSALSTSFLNRSLSSWLPVWLHWRAETCPCPFYSLEAAGSGRSGLWCIGMVILMHSSLLCLFAYYHFYRGTSPLVEPLPVYDICKIQYTIQCKVCCIILPHMSAGIKYL